MEIKMETKIRMWFVLLIVSTILITGLGSNECLASQSEIRNLSTSNVSGSDSPVTVGFGKNKIVKFIAKSNVQYLVLESRIKWHQLAGAASLMRLELNGKLLSERYLIGKEPFFRIRDGRSIPWFNSSQGSWTISYSPDFKANYPEAKGYANPGYQVMSGGEPYRFVFDVSGLIHRGRMNTLKIVNVANKFPNYPYRDVEIEVRNINLKALKCPTVSVGFGEKEMVNLFANNNVKYLVLESRIKWHQLAGAASLMRLELNGKLLSERNLIGKEPSFRIRDGRSIPWFNSSQGSWTISYSPDFKANYPEAKGYANPGYQVMSGGEPYRFVFDVSGLIHRGDMNILKIVNVANKFPNYPYRDVEIEIRGICLSDL